MLYKITNSKHLSPKEETLLIQALVEELNKNKQLNQLSVNILHENYEKWLIAKVKRKHVHELYK